MIQIEIGLDGGGKGQLNLEHPRNVKWTFKIPSGVMKCSVSLEIMFKLAAAHWRDVAEIAKAIHLQETRTNLWRADGDEPWRATADRATSSPASLRWAAVERAGRPSAWSWGWNDRPVKIDEVCPNEVCVLGDWVILTRAKRGWLTPGPTTRLCADM